MYPVPASFPPPFQVGPRAFFFRIRSPSGLDRSGYPLDPRAKSCELKADGLVGVSLLLAFNRVLSFDGCAVIPFIV